MRGQQSTLQKDSPLYQGTRGSISLKGEDKDLIYKNVMYSFWGGVLLLCHASLPYTPWMTKICALRNAEGSAK